MDEIDSEDSEISAVSNYISRIPLARIVPLVEIQAEHAALNGSTTPEELANRGALKTYVYDVPLLTPSEPYADFDISHLLGFQTALLEQEMQVINPSPAGETCLICKENPDSEELSSTKCNHLYHFECLSSWFSAFESSTTKFTCPYCTQTILGGRGLHDSQEEQEFIFQTAEQDRAMMKRWDEGIADIYALSA